MKLSEFCIKRPVFTVVLSLILIILGIMGYKEISLRAYPKEFHPMIQIKTTYSGANPQLVEQSITQVLENSLSSTPNLDSMQSTSSRGGSEINLKFKDISESTFLSVQSQVSREVNTAHKYLPTDTDPPTIFAGGDEDANRLMILAVADPNKTPIQLGDYVVNNIVKPIERLPGVSGVEAWSTVPALRINLKPEKLKQYKLTPQQIKTMLEANNQSINAGSLLGSTQSFQINTNLTLNSVSQFENLPIEKSTQGKLIKLKDIANVVLSSKHIVSGFHNLNAKQAIGLSITMADAANPIALGNSIHQKMQQLAKSFPPGMYYETSFDLSKPLQNSVNEVFYTVFEAIALVGLITFLFLGNIRAAIIPMATIPVCLISVFAIMLALGFSINIITLLAIVLAVGLVVDDAIVVLENTHRHIEEGLTPFKAAIAAMKEMGPAIIGITITLVAVYIPTVFMSGEAAIYFREFAFTLASAVLISGFVAVTLSPMMCAKVLKKHRLGSYETFIERFFKGLNQRYQRTLTVIFNKKQIVFLGFILLIISGGYVFLHLPTSNMPKNPNNQIKAIIKTPTGTNVALTEKSANDIARKIAKMPSIENVFSLGGGPSHPTTNMAMNFIHVKAGYTHNINQVVANINHLIKNDLNISGMAFAQDLNQQDEESDQQGANVFMITGQMDYKPLSKLVARFVKRLNQTPSIQGANTTLKFDDQEYNIQINRVLASELDVNISDITTTLNTMLGGTTLTHNYEYGGLSYPIVLQLPKQKLNSFANLQNVYVQSKTAGMLPLSRFVKIAPNVSLASRAHYNEMRAADVAFNVNPKYTLGQAMQTINALAKTMLPAGIKIVYTGEAKKLTEGNQSMLLIFLLGIVFIYLVLAALFESFIDPMVILFTVPLCIVGAVCALLFAGGSLNVLTGIGLVTLIGLVSKHGILITQFANQLRKEGLSAKEAAIKAAAIRLRPILMTTATMVIGAVPLVLATGFGANGRFQLGIVIIAGLIAGTFFSLIVVPIAYTLFAKLKPNT